MANKSVDSRQIALAEQIEEWAHRYRQSEDSYIVGLTEALRADEGLEAWATLDPNDYLPFPTVDAGARLAARNRLIITVRNVLVFAPVALTWIAVGQATEAFGVYVKENTSAVVNFLDFWQNGYGVLGEEFRIGAVARFDAILISLVIFLTLASAVIGQKARVMHSAQEKEADRLRMKLAVQIAIFLHEKSAVNSKTIDQAVIATIGKLLATANSLEATASRMGKSVEVTTKTIGKSLDKASTQVGKSLTATTKVVNKSLESATKSLGKHLDTTAKAAAKAAKRPAADFYEAQEDLAGEIEASTPTLPAFNFDFDRDFTFKSDEPKKRWTRRGKA